MSDISSINTSGRNLNVRRVGVDASDALSSAKEDIRARGGDRKSDSVELSGAAKYLSQLKNEPPQRTDLINRVKAEIEAGEYLTDDKLSAAADHLLEDINFEF